MRGNDSQIEVQKNPQLNALMKRMDALCELCDEASVEFGNLVSAANNAHCPKVHDLLLVMEKQMDKITDSLETLLGNFVHNGVR